MSRLWQLITVLCIAAVMAVIQYYALAYYLYWEYWWLDMLMHFLGGAVILLILYAAGVRRALVLLCTVLLVGILWEVYENLIGITLTEANIVTDTLSDLGLDLLGALGAYAMMWWWSPRSASPLPVAPGASPDQISSSP
jgi:hypothetical protein